MNIIKAKGAPSKFTKGSVGDKYIDLNTGKEYILSDIFTVSNLKGGYMSEYSWRSNTGIGIGLNLSDSLAEAFDPEKTYEVGELCIHNNKLHKRIVYTGEPGEWNEEAWTPTTIKKEFTDSLGTQVTFSLDGTTLNITTKQN